MKQLTLVMPAFIDSFKYLGKDNKRRGIQLFSNQALTLQLEALAAKLVSDITKIGDMNDAASWEILDTERGGQFITAIGDAYMHARNLRKSSHAKHSRFEKELLKGLKAVIKQIPNVLNAFSIGFQLDDKISSNDSSLNSYPAVRVIILFREQCHALYDQINQDKDIALELESAPAQRNNLT